MLDDQEIRKATEEVVAELSLSVDRFEVEAAMGAADGESSRQIRIFDAEGRDRAVVVSFQNKDGRVADSFDEIKAAVARQLQILDQT